MWSVVIMQLVIDALLLFFIGDLIGFHIYLRCKGITTYDFIRQRREKAEQLRVAKQHVPAPSNQNSRAPTSKLPHQPIPSNKEDVSIEVPPPSSLKVSAVLSHNKEFSPHPNTKIELVPPSSNKKESRRAGALPQKATAEEQKDEESFQYDHNAFVSKSGLKIIKSERDDKVDTKRARNPITAQQSFDFDEGMQAEEEVSYKEEELNYEIENPSTPPKGSKNVYARDSLQPRSCSDIFNSAEKSCSQRPLIAPYTTPLKEIRLESPQKSTAA
jgi:hypothetical protein